MSDAARPPQAGASDVMPMGRRIAYWRGRRRMSQADFADRLGKSKSWVDKVERGVRRIDKVSVVYEIAEVLQTDVHLLLGRDQERRRGRAHHVDRDEIEEVRTTLERCESIGVFLGGPAGPAPVAEIRKVADQAWVGYQEARYAVLARGLPRLLRNVQALDVTEADAEGTRLLAQVHQVAAAALRKLGEYGLAWLAADRGFEAALRTGDRLLVGTGARVVSAALLSIGRARPALEISTATANRLAATGAEPADPGERSVYGALLLQGSMAAARTGDATTARELLSGAARAAGDLDGDANHCWTSFNATNVQLYRAATAVELGDDAGAVAVHKRLDRSCFDALVPERRASHHLALARAHLKLGEVGRAGECLLACDRLAPSEIRARPVSHVLLSEVLRRIRGVPPAALTDLELDLTCDGTAPTGRATPPGNAATAGAGTE